MDLQVVKAPLEQLWGFLVYVQELPWKSACNEVHSQGAMFARKQQGQILDQGQSLYY